MRRGVLLIDDDVLLRRSFLRLVKACYHVECVTVGSLAELEALGPAALGFALAILDVNLGAGRPGGLEVYRWLRRAKFEGRIVFLTGHAASEPALAEVTRLDGVEVYEKPIAMAQLRALMEGV